MPSLKDYVEAVAKRELSLRGRALSTPSDPTEQESQLLSALKDRAFEAYAFSSPEQKMARALRSALGEGVPVKTAYPSSVAIDPKDTARHDAALLELQGMLESYPKDSLRDIAARVAERSQRWDGGESGADPRLFALVSEALEKNPETSFYKREAAKQEDYENSPSLWDILKGRLGMGPEY